MAEGARIGRERRLRPRHRVEVQAKATIRLFGAPESFELTTENVSESGLLLTSGSTLDHLNSSSILEVTLYLNPEKPISFLAKWVRNATDTSVGISITEIEPADQISLDSFILDLEKINKESETDE